MASSNSPCAACKLLRRKCTQECVFAPYFPPDQPQKFSNVHKVFGASNVTKLLNELSPAQREDAVNSLAYEADYRLRDPVYGCVGLISVLQHKLKQVQHDVHAAKKELTAYIGPSALLPYGHPQYPMLHPHMANSSSMPPFGMPPTVGLGLQPPSQALIIREQQQQQQQQQLLEAQQLAVAMAAREQEMMRNYEQQQQQQQQELVRFNSGFDGGGGGHGFNQMGGGHSHMGLVPFDNPFQVQEQQEHLHHHQRTGSDEGRSGIDPSS